MVNSSQIRAQMDVLGADGEHIGKVDSVEGARIKLARGSVGGEQHFIPLSDVSRVDDHVHLTTTRAAVLSSGASASTGGSSAATGAQNPLPEIKNPAVSSASPRRNYMLPWVLGALVLLALIGLLTQCGHHDSRSATTTTTTQTVTQHYAGAPLQQGTLAYDLERFLGSSDGLPRTFTFDRLNFDPGQATIRTQDLSDLDDIARVFAGYPHARAAIVGYTDAQGTPTANKQLGADRAKAVVAAFQQRGVDPSRLEARTGGADNPVASNAQSGGRFENRRTELVVLRR